MSMLLNAAGTTVANDIATGPAHWKRRRLIKVYAIGINTGGKTGEMNTIAEMMRCFNNKCRI